MNRINLSYNLTNDIEYSFMIEAGFELMQKHPDFTNISRDQVETRKSPGQLLNLINRNFCMDFFGFMRGYGYYLVGYSPLRVWSIESSNKQKSLGHILFFPWTSLSGDLKEIEEIRAWNKDVNDFAFKTYKGIVNGFFV